MKKLLFLIAVNLVIIHIIPAQTSFYAMDNSQSTGDNAIVRSWDNGNAAITYYEVGLKRYVQYVNYTTGDSYRSAAPDSVQILDMYIFNDTVYYCGYSVLDPGGRGVVGYFDPSDFYSLSGQVNFKTLPVPPLTHVRKLVVQKTETGEIEAIAIGEHKWYDTVFDVNGHVTQLIPRINRHLLFCRDMSISNVEYDTVLVLSDEHYYDVLLTNDYVVFVGMCTYLTTNMICLRATRRDMTDPSVWQLFDIYAYPTGVDEVYSAMHSTSMNNDRIATAYMHINTSTGDISNRIRVFDISTKLMTSSQEYFVGDKSELMDIVYIPKDNSLVCLHDFVTPLNIYSSNFVYLNPAATADYLTNIEYIKSVFFKSLTGKGIYHYLVSHGPTWFMKDKTNVATYPRPECPQKEKYDIMVLDNVVNINTNIPLPHTRNTELKFPDRKDAAPRYVDMICNNP